MVEMDYRTAEEKAKDQISHKMPNFAHRLVVKLIIHAQPRQNTVDPLHRLAAGDGRALTICQRKVPDIKARQNRHHDRQATPYSMHSLTSFDFYADQNDALPLCASQISANAADTPPLQGIALRKAASSLSQLARLRVITEPRTGASLPALISKSPCFFTQLMLYCLAVGYAVRQKIAYASIVKWI